MDTSDLIGFHFLPPSIRLPPELHPAHRNIVTAGVGTSRLAGPIAGTVYAAPLIHAADHVFPLSLGQT